MWVGEWCVWAAALLLLLLPLLLLLVLCPAALLLLARTRVLYAAVSGAKGEMDTSAGPEAMSRLNVWLTDT